MTLDNFVETSCTDILYSEVALNISVSVAHERWETDTSEMSTRGSLREQHDIRQVFRDGMLVRGKRRGRGEGVTARIQAHKGYRGPDGFATGR